MIGRLGDWEIGRLGDWESGRLGEWEKSEFSATHEPDTTLAHLEFLCALLGAFAALRETLFRPPQPDLSMYDCRPHEAPCSASPDLARTSCKIRREAAVMLRFPLEIEANGASPRSKCRSTLCHVLWQAELLRNFRCQSRLLLGAPCTHAISGLAAELLTNTLQRTLIAPFVGLAHRG